MALNVGIVGYGGFGRFLHRAWSNVEGVNVIAVADIAIGEDLDGVHVYRSWQQLIDDGEVDLISIATPPSSHAEIAVAALNRGVHVLVEKPVATTLSDAQAILDARNRSGRVATVDFMLRFNPFVRLIHGWCRSRPFGGLQRVVVENYAQDETMDAGHWFWDSEISGGILVEHGVHFFDIVNGCTSSPVTRVAHRSWPRDAEMTDRVFALVEYDDGLVASHYHAFNRLDAFERTSIRFVFDAAQVEIEGWIPMSGRIVALVGPDNRTALNDLPNLSVGEERPLHANRNTPLASASLSQAPVDTMISATFSLDGSKEDAYQAALRALMTDMTEAVRNSRHVMRVNLEDGIEALKLALHRHD